jgi:hypothetical protein
LKKKGLFWSRLYFPQTGALTGLRYAPTAKPLEHQGEFGKTGNGVIYWMGTNGNGNDHFGTQCPGKVPESVLYLFPTFEESEMEELKTVQATPSLGLRETKMLVECDSFRSAGLPFNAAPKTMDKLKALGLVKTGFSGAYGLRWHLTEAGKGYVAALAKRA